MPESLFSKRLYFALCLEASLVGVGVWMLTRSRWRTSPRLLDVGFAFEILGAYSIAFSETWNRLSATSLTWPGYALTKTAEVLGWYQPYQMLLGYLSWTCLWIVIFPLLLPAPPLKNAIVTLISALAIPLTWLLSAAINGVAQPMGDELTMLVVFWSIPCLLSAGLAIGANWLIHQLSGEIQKARELGSYRLVERLGQGGMGEVWRAEHRMLARPAAVKLIRKESLGTGSERDSQTLVQRFEREAQATALLRSPHAVTLYDFGVTRDGVFYYVMELLEGMDLATLVQRFGPLPPERVIHVLRQACHALGEAHEAGLIHRDIKPANLYACRFGRDEDFVKVLDFGLVKSIKPGRLEADLTQEGSFAGTPTYLAPEAISGETQDARSDIYSLGCVGYFLLTGQAVFSGRNVVQLLMQHAQAAPQAPSKLTPRPISAELDELILACLEKSPERRPQSVDELEHRLGLCEEANAWTAALAQDWWAQHGAKPNLIALKPSGELSATATIER